MHELTAGYAFFTVLAFAWGSCVGSFLNVCIHRIPRDLSIVAPRSFCPGCRRPIPWYWNVPLLSYTLLGGRCRFCRRRISPRYVLVEALMAVLFVLIWFKWAFHGDAPPLGLAPMADWKLIPVYWLAVSGLVLGTFVDFEHLIIPDRVTLGGVAAGLALSALVPSMHGAERAAAALARSAAGAALGAGVLWSLAVMGKWILQKDAMGLGDVKLLGAIGAFLGVKAVLFTILCSSLLGSLAGLALVACGRKQMSSRIPYGPYLALAALIWMLWGSSLWDAYLSLLQPAPPL